MTVGGAGCSDAEAEAAVDERRGGWTSERGRLHLGLAGQPTHERGATGGGFSVARDHRCQTILSVGLTMLMRPCSARPKAILTSSAWAASTAASLTGPMALDFVFQHLAGPGRHVLEEALFHRGRRALEGDRELGHVDLADEGLQVAIGEVDKVVEGEEA